MRARRRRAWTRRSPHSTAGDPPGARAPSPCGIDWAARERALRHRAGDAAPVGGRARGGAFVRSLSEELARNGHRMVVLAPSRSPALVRESRRLIRAGDFFDPDGGVRVLGVGELLPLAPARRGTPPSPPLDVARTLDDVLSRAPFDFVHVHEPFAPSTASIALRHSRALNVGTFHAPTERVISTRSPPLRRALLRPAGCAHGVVRGHARADGARLPGLLRGVARGGRDPGPPEAADDRRASLFIGGEDRRRCAVPASLRRRPEAVGWQRDHLSRRPTRAPAPASRVRDRVQTSRRGGRPGRALPAPTRRGRVVASGAGARACSCRCSGRAVPAAGAPARLRGGAHDGELGLLFERGDVDTSAAQLDAAARLDEGLRAATRAAGRPDGARALVVRGRLVATRGSTSARGAPHRRAVNARSVRLSRAHADRRRPRHADETIPTTARRRSRCCSRPPATQGLGAIAVTDDNEYSGALARAPRRLSMASR